MNQELLCTWLGLPNGAWPPDPWLLLGLPRGDHDLSAIEERVQDRMNKLRQYQLSYPEEATEGMNRLAEAFVSLAEACAKKAVAAPTPGANGTARSKDDTSIIQQTRVDWRAEPPPVRQDEPAAPEVIADDDKAVGEPLLSKPFVAPARPHRREIDAALVRELAEHSEEATSDVGTLDAVVTRIESTRRLLYVWERVGRYLRATAKKPSIKENEQFARRMETVAEVMQHYPAFLGHPGKPGYRVVVLARLRIPLPIVRAMTPDQRDELLFDWQVGYQVLLTHRKYLRLHFKSLRHRSAIGLAMHAVRAALNDHPRWTLAGMMVVIVLAVLGAARLAL